MKKILMSAALVTMLVASCQNDEIVSQAEGVVSVKAVMGINSRTTVDNGGQVTWTTGDKMIVYGGKSKGVLTLEGNGGSKYGTFTGFVQGSLTELTTALYPAEMATSDGTITLSQVTYPNSNSPMVAVWNENGLQFSHLGGMVRMTILNVPDTRSELELTGIGIAGKATLNGTALTTTKSENNVKVTIPAGNGGKLIIDVPVFATESGTEVDLTVTLNGKPYIASGASEATKISTALKVGSLNTSDMPEMEVKEDGSLSDATSWSDDTLEDGNLTPDDYGEYLISSAEDLAKFADMVNNGETFMDKTVKLIGNIDLLSKEWTPIGDGITIEGNKKAVFKGTFNGQDYIISNLKVETEGNAPAGLFGASLGTIKNLKINDVDIKGHYKAGAIVGDGLCAKIENCHVTGGTITSTPHVVSGKNDDANNVGGIVGYLSAEPTAYVKNCSVNGLVITAYRDVAGIVGHANGTNSIISGNKVSNTTIIADQTVDYVAAKAANAGEIVGRKTTTPTISENTVGEGVNVVIKYKEIEVGTSDELVEGLENLNSVVLTSDIKIDPANMSNAYGTTGINVKYGQMIDGNGHTLDIKGAGGTWDSGINTTGGKIKDLKVTGSFRGIFINHNSDYSGKVILENVTIDGTTYTISCDQGTDNGLEATNSTFNGWTSYAATLGNAKFIGCSFGAGNGYAYCRPYASTEFINCDFEAGYEMDTRAACTFTNCKLNGVTLTADNLSILVTSNISNATVK